MGRRKPQYIDDSDSDSDNSKRDSDGYNSQEDADSRAERQLFERNSRKRRRTGGKESAWEGIFGEDDDVPPHPSHHDRRGPKTNGAFKAPNFVRPSAPVLGKQDTDEAEVSMKGSSNDDNDSESEGDSEEEERRHRPPVVREPSEDEDEEEAQPRGLGSGAGRAGVGAGLGAGVGAKRVGGIGSSNASSASTGRTTAFTASTTSTFTLSKPATSEKTVASNSSTKDDTAFDMQSGLGTANRARLEQAEEEILYPKDEAHAYPQGFGRQHSRKELGSNDPSRAGSRGSTPGSGGGIGSRRSTNFTVPAPASGSSTPTVRPEVTAKDLRHLNSISNSFGARMLAKFGWEAGKGLGADESGKAVPIEANVGLQKGQGIGKGVRTEQSRRDAKARGEKFSSDEEDDKRTRKSKNRAAGGAATIDNTKGESASWKKQRKVKVKVEHKTYEQLIAEAGEEGKSVDEGVGLVLDARSGELKEVSSVAAATSSSHWTPSSDKTQLPELRHNLRLILDASVSDVAALAREGKGIEEKKKWAVREAERLEKVKQASEQKILRLQTIHAITQHISTLASEATFTDGADPLGPFTVDFNKLIEDFREEYDEYDLDEVVVGAISQALAPMFKEFQPLVESDVLLRILEKWKRAYRYSEMDRSEVHAMEVYGATQVPADGDRQAGLSMTPFESLIYHLWLPKVRSALNNEWDVANPQPAIRLIESWGPLLPRFILDNVVDQLILPKLHKQVREWSWNPRSVKSGAPAVSLASIVFPWLAPLKSRSDHVLDEAKIRVGEVMKRWKIKDVIPDELQLWKTVFSRGKWDTLILLNILPKLAQHLDSDFEINPRSQDMAPLDRVLGWSRLMRESTFAQLLTEKFFPAWLDTLHFWLIQPNYNAGEVASWYQYWKDYLANYTTARDENLSESRDVEHGFRTGLKLMNEAMSLGAEAPKRLAKPDLKSLPDKKSRPVKSTTGRSAALPTDQPEITFRSIAEQHAAGHNLLFVPTGKSHSATGKQLFKVSKSFDGKGGITVYVGDDAVYAMMEDGSFRPVLLDDMVKMAEKR